LLHATRFAICVLFPERPVAYSKRHADSLLSAPQILTGIHRTASRNGTEPPQRSTTSKYLGSIRPRSKPVQQKLFTGYTAAPNQVVLGIDVEFKKWETIQ
jgi:hypothetical protein